MTSKGKSTKGFKPKDPEIESPVQQIPQRETIRYFMKYEMEVNDQNVQKQCKKRFHVKRWKLSGENQQTNERKLRQLETILKSKNNMEVLVLENFKLSNIKKTSLIKINAMLKNQPTFENFTSSFLKGKIFCEDEDLHSIYELLKSVHYLKKVNLHLEDPSDFDSLTDEGVQKICKTLQKLRALKAIKLDFVECKNITKAGAKMICETLKRLVSLQKIFLNFNDSSNVLSEGLEGICEVMELSTPHLRELSLKFRGIDMNNTQIQRLSQALEKTTCLQSFLIGFNDMEKTEIAELSEVLSGLEHLKKLTFNLEVCIPSAKKLITFAQNLERLTCLQQINLKFPHSRGITDEGLRSLAESLGRLTSLQDLALTFNNVSDNGPKRIIQMLSKLLSLKRLDLNFRFCNQINNESVQDLNECIKHLKLQSLSLDFVGCPLTDNGIESLSEALEQMNSLRDVRFIFPRGLDINKAGMNYLAESFKKLKCIERIEIIFSICRIPTQCINKVRNAFETMPSVKYVFFSKDETL